MSKSLEQLINPHKFTPSIVRDGPISEELWNTKRAWVLSSLSHIAYFREDDVKVLMQKLGANKTTFYINDGAQGFLSEWDDKAVLVFRGSQLMEHLPKKFEHLNFFYKLYLHIRIRLQFNISRLPFINNDFISNFTFCHARLTQTKGVKVHSGFLKETKKLWKSVIKDLRNLKDEKPLWVTGHSLGGAMALITAMKYPVKEVLTFGSPRVGRGIKKVISNEMHTRYVNGDDIVTKLPPPWFSYYLHHGMKKHIIQNKENLFLDHSIIDYSKEILRND